ncbi:asparagine synthase-related protein [Halomarina litorea]|uniref:asparagine synthase-related protein n=1 Tax=Halomarina litorea TaxID=2961595 RepID=UPI0020C4835B|nr:asparagine synthase-related protein [Halomarina sp. BCD28]
MFLPRDMVGLCGTIGRTESNALLSAQSIAYRGDELITGLHRQHVDAYSVEHQTRPGTSDRPGAAGDVEVLVWGDLYGHERDGRYVPRRESHPTATTAEYLASLYTRYGFGCLAGLNGEFAAAVYDAGTVSLVTDRLGSRAVFYATADDGSTVFSTAIQSLALDERLDLEFETDYLVEYLTYERAFGTKTPLAGVEKVPPGSVLTIHTATGATETERYWYPEYAPKNVPREYFVRELARRFRAAMADRMADRVDYGVMLSGGVDSRLLVGVGSPGVAYHLTGWESEETRTAREVARLAGWPFRPLWRDRDYQARALERTPFVSNYIGGFDEGHATGFLEQVRQEVDVMLSGHLSDTLFAANYLPRKSQSVPLPGFGSFDLPIPADVETIEEFIDQRELPAPPYLSEDVPIPREVLERNVVDTDDGIDHHGVHYRSVADAVLCDQYYPRSNAKPFFEYTTEQYLPLRKPFMDNRLVDLHLQIPRRYLVSGNLIGGAMRLLAPELGHVPDNNTGVDPRHPFLLHYVGKLWTHVRRTYLPTDTPPEPHLSNGPWPDNAALIRTHSFVEDALSSHEAIAEQMAELDVDGIYRTYREHLDGADRTQHLYSLLTFLAMPLTDHLVSASTVVEEELTSRP